MAATGELALLPVLSPMRVGVLEGNRSHNHRPRLIRQPRVYRLPPSGKTIRFAYGPGGHTVLQRSKGRIIDLYT